MNRGKLTIGIILIFVLGGLAGGLAVQLYHNFEHRGGPPPLPPMAKRIDFIVERLTDDLDLAPKQVAEIRLLVEKNEREITEFRTRVDPEMKKIHNQGFSAIRERLDPDQQHKLDKLVERLNKFHHEPPP